MKPTITTTTALLLSLLTNVSADGSCSIRPGVTLTSYGSGSTPGKIVYPNFLCAPGSGQTLTAQPGSVQGGDANILTSGDGSYNNPATMATALDNPSIKPCAIVYIPWLKKYFKNADRCEACTTDFAAGTWHLDLWTGPPPSEYGSSGGEEGTCESKWGSSTHNVILNPGPNLPVETGPMDDGTTCFSPLDDVKRVFDDGGVTCSSSGSSGSGSGSGSGTGGDSSASSSSAVAQAPQYTPPPPASTSSSAAAVTYAPPSTFSTVVVPSSSSAAASPVDTSSSSSSSVGGEKKKTEGAKSSSSSSGGGKTCSTWSDCNPNRGQSSGLICVCGQCVDENITDFGHCKMY